MDFYEFLGGQNSEETLRAYKTDLEQFRDFAGGDLSRGGVILFRDTLVQRGMSPSTIARKMSSVRSYCDFLRGQGKLTADPFAGIKIPKASVSDPTQAFTDEEVRKMFKVCKDRAKPVDQIRDMMILGLLFFAGLRRSEVVGLRFCDLLDMDGQLVLRILGKGGKYRMMPAHPKLAEILLPQLAGTPLIPKTNSTNSLLQVSSSTIYNIVKKYAKLAGIKRKVSPHSCRATAISQLLENGESPRNVADFAGHSNVTTTVNSYDKKRDGLKNSSAMKLNF